MLSVSQLTASYDGSRILRGINLDVQPGEVVCLMGRNGVGKSTTLKTIVGHVRADSGEVLLDGTQILKLPPDERARLGLAYVPQGRDIFPTLTVEENLRIGAVAQGRTYSKNLDRVFHLFPVLKEMLGRRGGVLSGGQQQQLAIGRALLTEPKVLLLDEPTEGIQPNIIDQIGDTLKTLRIYGLNPTPPDDGRIAHEIGKALKTLREERQIGILLVEQYLDFCVEVGDRFFILERGSVVAQGPIAQLDQDMVRLHLTV